MFRIVRNTVLVVLAVIWLIPVYLLVVNAITPLSAYQGEPLWLPVGFDLWSNLVAAWNESSLGLGLLNSLLYSTVSALVAVLAAGLAGFAVVTMPVRRPALWFWVIYLGTLLPLQIFLAPLFQTYVNTNLYDTSLGMILIYSAICVPFAFFVVRNYLTTIPPEIAEAAKLDGAGWARLFFEIHLPLIRSAMFAAFIFQFTWVWNDLLFGITLTTSPDRRPVMAAMAEIGGGFVSLGPPVVLAGALLVSLPTVILFLSCQRFFVTSLRAAA